MSTKVFVFADWEEFEEPALVGTLRSSTTRQNEHFSFSYDADWLQSPCARQIDPELNLYSGEQHDEDGNNFRVFLDSCPDRWGRLLMKRRFFFTFRYPSVVFPACYIVGASSLELHLPRAFARN